MSNLRLRRMLPVYSLVIVVLLSSLLILRYIVYPPNDELPCIEPSLGSNDLHVVIAGYKVDACHYQYAAEMGLTNAKVISYRRVDPELPLRRWELRCGVTVHERLLLPNHGLEAAAFYSYVSVSKQGGKRAGSGL